MRSMIAFASLVLLAVGGAQADGKMFWREKVPPGIPYQRALILHADGVETLVLQSRYQIPTNGAPKTIGWVVPVPSVPEIASMPAAKASTLFLWLSRGSQPRVTRILPMIAGGVFLVVAGLAVALFLISLLSVFISLPAGLKMVTGKMYRFALWGLLCSLLFAIGLPSFVKARGSLGVDVISEQRVGIYDVQTVRSDDATGLVAWLNDHKFAFEEKDVEAFRAYISKGWCFVVAVINPSAEQKPGEVVAEGLAAPLILRFARNEPVYPLALTATGGFDTEVLLYVASAGRMSAGGRMTLRYAGPDPIRWFELLTRSTEPSGFIEERPGRYPFLCKFKDRLTAAQMTEDLVLTPDKDDSPYREHIVRW